PKPTLNITSKGRSLLSPVSCCRRDPEQEIWRRSWGSRDENKDEFWAALQSNYNYLMDNHLIDSCKIFDG
ncbi:unnamed protein product, partial [Timema podura]|nr:unnamed protein product [Timema podura]